MGIVAALAIVPIVAATAVAVLLAPSAQRELRDLTDGGPSRATNRGPAPAFALDNLVEAASPVALDDYRGRPVVLNFWASWCVPCRREMPVLADGHRRVGDRVAFVGINHQDRRSDALELLADTGVTYPSGFDPDGGVARAYAIFGLPTTVFISADGEILEQRTGELSTQQLEAALGRLFGVDARAAP
ncbi:MAG: TlpA family protein disulfide reductase [Actinomycetota bacterium]